jgi:hypothetical protein
MRKHMTAEAAMSGLKELLVGLRRVRGSNSDGLLMAQDYVMWSEHAEDVLRSLFADPAIARLQSERYWRIREVDDSTLRSQPLIRAETSDREHLLRQMLEQVSYYTSRLSVAADEQLLVIDSNVLLHGASIEEARWHDLVNADRVTLVLPLPVIDELDAIKDRRQQGSNQQSNKQRKDISVSAREVLAWLHRALPGNNALARTNVTDRVAIQLVDEPFGHQRLTGTDDEIVRQSQYFQSVSGSVTIVTRDKGMRVRAEAAGLRVKMPVADQSEYA